MASGWLREEIEDVRREVKDWPEWKKATAGDKDSSETQRSSSSREQGSNLPQKT